jgi:hypothetical protein
MYSKISNNYGIIFSIIIIVLSVKPIFAAGLGFYTNADFGYFSFKNQTYPITNPKVKRTENAVVCLPGLE